MNDPVRTVTASIPAGIPASIRRIVPAGIRTASVRTAGVRNLAVAVALLGAGAVVGPRLPVAADSPPTSAGAAAISTGARSVFVPIESYRAYDSRTDTLAGKIQSSQAGDVGRNQRPVYAPYENQGGPALIPVDAVAVTYNVQAVQTVGSGFMHVDGFFNADGSASTLVWSSSGERVSNSGVAMLTSAFDDPGALGVFVDGSPGAATHVIIDITGYFVSETP